MPNNPIKIISMCILIAEIKNHYIFDNFCRTTNTVAPFQYNLCPTVMLNSNFKWFINSLKPLHSEFCQIMFIIALIKTINFYSIALKFIYKVFLKQYNINLSTIGVKLIFLSTQSGEFRITIKFVDGELLPASHIRSARGFNSACRGFF